VVVSLEIPAVMEEALTVIAALIEAVLLHHGAHRPIEQHDALIQRTLQALDALLTLGLIRRRHCERRSRRADRSLLAARARPVGAWSRVMTAAHVEAPAATAVAMGCLPARTPSA